MTLPRDHKTFIQIKNNANAYLAHTIPLQHTVFSNKDEVLRPTPKSFAYDQWSIKI